METGPEIGRMRGALTLRGARPIVAAGRNGPPARAEPAAHAQWPLLLPASAASSSMMRGEG